MDRQQTLDTIAKARDIIWYETLSGKGKLTQFEVNTLNDTYLTLNRILIMAARPSPSMKAELAKV